MAEFYKHPAPLALRTENDDSNDLLFALWRLIILIINYQLSIIFLSQLQSSGL
jgi:hypothetical protein